MFCQSKLKRMGQLVIIFYDKVVFVLTNKKILPILFSSLQNQICTLSTLITVMTVYSNELDEIFRTIHK